MRVAPASVQLALPDPAMTTEVDRWWSLPEQTRAQVLTMLAALIARGVLIDPDDALETPTGPDAAVDEGE